MKIDVTDEEMNNRLKKKNCNGCYWCNENECLVGLDKHEFICGDQRYRSTKKKKGISLAIREKEAKIFKKEMEARK